jgi:hypothetical protein
MTNALDFDFDLVDFRLLAGFVEEPLDAPLAELFFDAVFVEDFPRADLDVAVACVDGMVGSLTLRQFLCGRHCPAPSLALCDWITTPSGRQLLSVREP